MPGFGQPVQTTLQRGRQRAIGGMAVEMKASYFMAAPTAFGRRCAT